MELCDEYLHDYIKIYPPLNDTLGYEKYLKKRNILPNHYSQILIKKESKLTEKYYDILMKKKDKSFYDNIFLFDLKYDKKLSKYKFSDYLLDIEDNILFEYYEICLNNSYISLNTKDDYVVIMNRLKKMTGITNEMIKILEDGIKNKVFINYLIIDNFLYKCKTILASDINKIKGIPISIKKQFLKSIQKNIIENIRKINEFVLEKYVKFSNKQIGLYSYPSGKQYYKEVCKYNTLPNLTPEAIHDLGIKELQKDLSLKKELAKKIGVDDIDDYMYKNDKFFSTEEEVLKYLYKLRTSLQKRCGKLFYDNIDDLYEIKTISKQNGNDIAYYIGPNDGNKNKGTFYINTLNPEKISKYSLLVLSLHEGIPGHHYEAVLNEKSNKSEYIKHNLYSSYSEGWGLYCESLFEYTNDKEYYYKLQYSVERSLRLILDTGIHYYGWDKTKCFEYMKKYLKYYSDDFINDQILRYSSNPGQALTYKIGEQVILYLKEKFMKKNNDIKAFHKLIMDTGPCPLEILIKRFHDINL